jgi:hypothetical protein
MLFPRVAADGDNQMFLKKTQRNGVFAQTFARNAPPDGENDRLANGVVFVKFFQKRGQRANKVFNWSFTVYHLSLSIYQRLMINVQ